MPHYATAVTRVLRPKFERPQLRTRNGHVKEFSIVTQTGNVEGKQQNAAAGPGLRPARRKTLNPVKTSLNIHERPVRKKKKTLKYETYERDRGVLPLPHHQETSTRSSTTETNVLKYLGLTPVSNGLNRMHVVDNDGEKPSSPVPAESPDKNAAVSTTVDEQGDVEGAGADAQPVTSPKENGICDSGGSAENGSPKSRRSSKEEVIVKMERSSPTVRDDENVESSEPQDLTVTCTSSVELPPKPSVAAAKYISISVEQCKTGATSSSTSSSVSMPSKKAKTFLNRKRSTKSSDSDEAATYKRGRIDERESSVAAFVEQASSSGLDDLQRHADALKHEINGYNLLARNKELEWNEIIRIRKLKEEMYLRLIRRKETMLLLMHPATRPAEDNTWDFSLENRMSEFIANDEVSLNRVKPRLPSNLTITKSQSGVSQQLQRALMQPQRQEMQQPTHSVSGNARLKNSKSHRAQPFPILPKPVQYNDQNNSSGSRQAGLQGPIVDVKSIIADYRQSHPETIPRRGRRLKTSSSDNLVTSSRSVLNMSNIALGSGSQVRTVGSTSGPEETSRPSSADSSRSEHHNMKDVYIQYGKMGNASSSSKIAAPLPEVTLHPVMPGSSQSPPPHSSLLHGILTKTSQTGVAAAVNGPSPNGNGKTTAFSPTLARLLTTPDRPSTTTTITTTLRAAGTSTSSSPGPVSISELLSTSKTRNELTITPVVSNTQPAKSVKEESSNTHEEDGDEQDRLVIDEGEEEARNEDTENDPPETVPECQGCHQRAAQFVCAGCSNQWYCSRNCQVTSWDEHSEICSG